MQAGPDNSSIFPRWPTTAGITHNTAKAWISVLEASYIVHLLPPHHQNFNKRLVKTPKLYFLDTGLATWLLGIQNNEQLATHVQRGALFETWVISELLKARYNAVKPRTFTSGVIVRDMRWTC